MYITRVCLRRRRRRELERDDFAEIRIIESRKKYFTKKFRYLERNVRERNFNHINI